MLRSIKPTMKHQLHTHPIFQARTEFLSREENATLTYERALLLAKAHPLTIDDVQKCTPRFWALFKDPLCAIDIPMFILLLAHVNLVLGTLSTHLKHRPDLKPLVEKLLRFEILGLFQLTERGHGVDAFNIETTATKTSHGFILNTPREEAAKFMPATSPRFGIPKISLVSARLIVNEKDYGSRFFIVPICNEREMYQGIESITLPPRSGTQPLDWSITRFTNVRLPLTALVSSDTSNLSPPKNPLKSWWEEVWRIPIGSLIIPYPWIVALKATAQIGGQYSMHRCILGKGGLPTPIIKFRTQQWPIAHATAVAIVLDTWHPGVVDSVLDISVAHNVRHALLTIAKTTVCRHFQRCVSEVSERCGAQGTFEHNFMAKWENEVKGAVTGEGDLLPLCIRLFAELVLKRYEVPLPPPEDSLLARHASALLQENIKLFATLGSTHRDDSFNNLLLPQSQVVIEAMGHALAHAAALKAGIPKYVLDVYEAAVIRQDPTWYSECAGVDRLTQKHREAAAVSSMLHHLPTLLAEFNMGEYYDAPILSDAKWKSYLVRLPVHSGNAVPPEGLYAKM